MEHKPAALITGSAVRLGKAIAVGLAQEGYDIALHYHSSREAAQQTAAEISALGVECVLFQQNLAVAEQLDGFITEVIKQMPGLNLLVNSASAYESGTIATTSVETFDQQMAINLRAPFFLSKAFAAQVGRGLIINIIDNKIMFNQHDYAAYLLSKKALAAMTYMAAIEFAPAIRVNGVAPGVVMPADSRSEAYVDWRTRKIPLQKQGSPDHIVQAIRFILHNDFLAGQVIVVDGGEGHTNVGFNFTQFQNDD